MRLNLIRHSIYVFALIATTAYAAPQNISEIDIQRSGFLYNRLTDTFDTTVTIRNTGSIPLVAPIRLVVDEVIPLSVSLYNIHGKTDDGKPYVEVPLKEFKLSPDSSATVPVRFVNLGRTVTEAKFSVQGQLLDPSTTAELEIVAKMNQENGGNPVPAGYAIKVDGVKRALTDTEGHVRVAVPIDSSGVSVSHPPNFFGAAHLEDLAAGETRSVSVELGDSGELGADSILRIDRLQHLMLPLNTPQVILRFFEDEKAVASDLIELVELRDPAGGDFKDITNLFTIRPDGGLYASSTAFFSAVGDLNGKKLLFAQVLDKKGTPHLDEVTFYVSRFQAQGRLTSPPSKPDLPLGGIKIEASILNTDIVFQTQSAADGSFPLPQLPAGNVSLKATTVNEGVSYLGAGTAVISGNTRINLRMRGPADITNNVPPITTSPM